MQKPFVVEIRPVFTLITGKIKKRKDEFNYMDEFLITQNSDNIKQDVELSILLRFKMSQFTCYRQENISLQKTGAKQICQGVEFEELTFK